MARLGEAPPLDLGEPRAQRLGDGLVGDRVGQQRRRRAGDELPAGPSRATFTGGGGFSSSNPGCGQSAGFQWSSVQPASDSAPRSIEQDGAGCAMMAGMKHGRWFLLALLALLPSTALAQFYDLDGAYHCLTTPDTACEKDLRDQPRPAPPPKTTTLDEVIAKVRAKELGPHEAAILEKRAAANDPAPSRCWPGASSTASACRPTRSAPSGSTARRPSSASADARQRPGRDL